jgi:hypothetical protein
MGSTAKNKTRYIQFSFPKSLRKTEETITTKRTPNA